MELMQETHPSAASEVLVTGLWIQDLGIMDPARFLKPPSWILDPRSRASRILDPGSWVVDPGSWVLDVDRGPWLLNP